jgi:hypothetical protein
VPGVIILTEAERQRLIEIAKQQLFYDAVRDILDPVNKIIVDTHAGNVHIYQVTENGPQPLIQR